MLYIIKTVKPERRTRKKCNENRGGSRKRKGVYWKGRGDTSEERKKHISFVDEMIDDKQSKSTANAGKCVRNTTRNEEKTGKEKRWK